MVMLMLFVFGFMVGVAVMSIMAISAEQSRIEDEWLQEWLDEQDRQKIHSSGHPGSKSKTEDDKTRAYVHAEEDR